MSLLIRNGRIVTATEDYHADVLCDGASIVRIEPSIDPASAPDAEIIDATGKYVMPGFIDPHVHIHLPFMGTHAKDTYVTASRTALVGGTTTIIEMACAAKSDDHWAAYELWKGNAEGKSACDYTFHMGVSRFDDETESALRRIVADGTASFKVFLAYKGAFGVDDRELFHALKLARELGVIVTAHCENETLVDALQAELLAAGKTGPGYHEPSRPPHVESEGVHHLMTFAQMTGAHVYVVHTSCIPAVRMAEDARRRGVKVWIETVIPYLTLDHTYAERPDFEGAKYVMSPPIRSERHQRRLWRALASRSISTVATDHAPFDFNGQKDMGRDDFTKIPNGVPSIENRVDLLHTFGVRTGRIDLNTFVDCLSTQAARLFGLEKKGAIRVGADADLVVYDPDKTWTVRAADQEMAVDYNAYEGFELTGKSDVVTLRGKVQVRDGKFVGEIGHGERIVRRPTH